MEVYLRFDFRSFKVFKKAFVNGKNGRINT